MVLALVLVRGAVLAVDNPTRQSFVIEIVGPERVVNAVSLNSVIVHTARIVGPMLAGVLIALVGVAPCFAAQRALVRGHARRAAADAARGAARAAPAPRARGADPRRRRARSWRRPRAADPAGDDGRSSERWPSTSRCCCPCSRSSPGTVRPATYALLTSAMGVGSVAGALVAGARDRVSPRLLVVAATLFGVAPLRRRGRADARAAGRGARAARRRERDVRRGRQLHPAARRRARAARARHGALLRRVPRVDADRRAARRLARRGRGPAAGMALGGAAALVAAAWGHVAFRRARERVPRRSAPRAAPEPEPVASA